MNLSDIFASNLRDHQYIEARGLNPKVKRITTPTYEEANAPYVEMLPAVLNILESYQPQERLQ